MPRQLGRADALDFLEVKSTLSAPDQSNLLELNGTNGTNWQLWAAESGRCLHEAIKTSTSMDWNVGADFYWGAARRDYSSHGRKTLEPEKRKCKQNPPMRSSAGLFFFAAILWIGVVC